MSPRPCSSAGAQHPASQLGAGAAGFPPRAHPVRMSCENIRRNKARERRCTSRRIAASVAGAVARGHGVCPARQEVGAVPNHVGTRPSSPAARRSGPLLSSRRAGPPRPARGGRRACQRADRRTRVKVHRQDRHGLAGRVAQAEVENSRRLELMSGTHELPPPAPGPLAWAQCRLTLRQAGPPQLQGNLCVAPVSSRTLTRRGPCGPCSPCDPCRGPLIPAIPAVAH